MADLRYAAVHWPENAGGEHPNAEAILRLPGVSRGALLICSPSARYWYQQARAASPLVVWRAIPRHGRLPAELRWNRKHVADEVLNLWDEQPHGNGVEWFLPLNELQFDKENGGPWPGYQQMAQNLAALRIELRARLPDNVKLMWPAWVPSDDGTYLDQWRAEAEQYDAICLHTYGSAETMRARYQSYRDAFPGMPILVGEWNANHEGHDEYAALEMWADVATTDPAFLGACYYIWETQNDGEQALSIWGNNERLRIFQQPPVIVPVIDAPSPEPDPILPPTPDPPPHQEDAVALPQGLDVASWQGQPDWAAVAAAGYTFAITKETQGIGYVNPTAARNWPEIKAAGMFRGAYHYANPDTNGPEAEADFFVTHMLGVGLEAGDVLALDLEEGSGDLGGWALRWLKRVEERVGFAPILYTGPWIINEHDLAATPELGRFGLWLAAYQPTMPAPPAPWETIAIWQNASDVSVPGIVGPVDHDYFNGDIARLPLYGKPGAVPAPVPVGGWDVGAGILEAMAARGDSAATSEAYVTADWSEAIGTSGTVYRWVKSVGRVFVYPPAA